MKHERLHIGGMTCVNCQNEIVQKLRSTAGVESASVSYGEGIADIVYDPAILSRQDIEGLFAVLGYTVQPGPQSGQGSVGRTVCLLVIVICLYILLQRFGVLNLLAPSQLAETSMDYDSGRGYYVQSGGCNPWPIFPQSKTVTDDAVCIAYDELHRATEIFAGWKQ